MRPKRKTWSLKCKKHKLEDKVEQMTEKVAKLEADIRKESGSAQFCKKKFKKNQSEKLIKMQKNQSGMRGADKGKKFNDYTKRHQQRLHIPISRRFIYCALLPNIIQ